MADFCAKIVQQVDFGECGVFGLSQCEALPASQKREHLQRVFDLTHALIPAQNGQYFTQWNIVNLFCYLISVLLKYIHTGELTINPNWLMQRLMTSHLKSTLSIMAFFSNKLSTSLVHETAYPYRLTTMVCIYCAYMHNFLDFANIPHQRQYGLVPEPTSHQIRKLLQSQTPGSRRGNGALASRLTVTSVDWEIVAWRQRRELVVEVFN